MSGNSSIDSRVQQLREHIEAGRHPDSFIPESEQVDPDPPDQPPRRDQVTVAQCNAIRCAAQDGKNAGEIADLFDCVNSRRTVYDHITDSQYCTHDTEIEPVMGTETIDAADCRRIRSWYETGDVRQRDIADAVGCPRTTVRYHLNGRCSHTHDHE